MSAGARHPGDIDEGPLPELPQRVRGAALAAAEEAARKADADAAAERARRGECGSGLI